MSQWNGMPSKKNGRRETIAKAKRYQGLEVRAAKRLARGKGGAATLKRASNNSFDVSKHTGGVDLQELIDRRKAAKG